MASTTIAPMNLEKDISIPQSLAAIMPPNPVFDESAT
jgi:hypothetical protein